ncbi:MAG TPA: hypothetical protein VHH36_01345 [Candidatus Thermoplasmatota archaeon]|nr:hypothetical protein [Candidatus Thermoplasmatota archaeon]
MRSRLAALALLAALLVPGPASAVYVVTPLRLVPSAAEAQAGDGLTLAIEPNPEDPNASLHANRPVRVTATT